MLFVNISQAPYIIALIGILLILIAGAVYRQYLARSLFFSKEQRVALLSHHLKWVKITKIICLCIITIMLGISLLDPRGSSLSSELELEGIDIVLVYDISRSMDVEDVNESRLSLSKKLGAQLVDSLVGNRIGLVAFAADAVRLLPLTTDVSSVNLFIDELSTDMLGSQSTDIGKALDEAMQNFREDTLTHKSIVLFTDGENLDGAVNTDLIKKQGISLSIVGVGTEEGGRVPTIDQNTGITNYLQNIIGQTIISKLDANYLKDLAQKVNGNYIYGSRSTIIELGILIDNITKNPFGSNTQSFLEPKFRVFILCALFALILYLFLPDAKKMLILLLFLSTNTYSLTAERNAYSSYQNGEYSTALRFFQRSLIKDPKNIKSKFGEGATLYKLERSDRAENSFLSLTNSENTKIAQQSIFNAGNARVQKKDYEGALELYKEIMKENPTDSQLYRKALNNYTYVRALQQQENQNQQQNDQENKDSGQDNQDSQNQQDSSNQDKQDEQSEQDQQSESNDQNQEEQQQAQQQEVPSQSISDIDNLLGVAEKDEKDNISKQFQKEKGIFEQNKY